MMMDIDVFAPSHSSFCWLGAWRAPVFPVRSPFDWWEQCKEKRVCGEHIDARARTCVPVRRVSRTMGRTYGTVRRMKEGQGTWNSPLDAGRRLEPGRSTSNSSFLGLLFCVILSCFAEGAWAVTVVAGGEHTCAILNDGSVKCWGKNYKGQRASGRDLSMGRKIRRRTGLPGRAGCGLRGASGGMDPVWLVMIILVAHVVSVNAVFRPSTRKQLDDAINSCLTNGGGLVSGTGRQCCSSSGCYVDDSTGTVYDDIGDWDTSLITDMSSLFMNMHAFNADISGWDTSQVTTMENMFNAWGFNQDISAWNTAKVTNMKGMFARAAAFNQPIGTWDTSTVTKMSHMFSMAAAFNQPIGTWDTSQVTDMEGMFTIGPNSGDTAAFNQPIGTWNTAQVRNMGIRGS